MPLAMRIFKPDKSYKSTNKKHYDEKTINFFHCPCGNANDFRRGESMGCRGFPLYT